MTPLEVPVGRVFRAYHEHVKLTNYWRRVATGFDMLLDSAGRPPLDTSTRYKITTTWSREVQIRMLDRSASDAVAMAYAIDPNAGKALIYTYFQDRRS